MQKQFKGNSEMSDGCNSSNQATDDETKGKNTSHASPNLHVSGELNNTLNKSSSADNLPLIPNVNTAWAFADKKQEKSCSVEAKHAPWEWVMPI